MKKSKFFLIVLLGIGLFYNQTFSQEKGYVLELKVPVVVLKSFQAKFPTAKNVVWSMEKELEYEAEFYMNRQKMSANFMVNGEWKETEWSLSEKKLPLEIKKTLKNQFHKYNLEKAEVSDTPEKGKVYEVTLEKDESMIEVVLKGNGKVIKEENIGRENDEKEGKEEKEEDSGGSLIL